MYVLLESYSKVLDKLKKAGKRGILLQSKSSHVEDSVSDNIRGVWVRVSVVSGIVDCESVVICDRVARQENEVTAIVHIGNYHSSTIQERYHYRETDD